MRKLFERAASVDLSEKYCSVILIFTIINRTFLGKKTSD